LLSNDLAAPFLQRRQFRAWRQLKSQLVKSIRICAMPELPEVEVTRRGLALTLTGATVLSVRHSGKSLRWPVPIELGNLMAGKDILEVGRRGKYLLVRFDTGYLIIHLGMSGSLHVVPASAPPGPWDHFDLNFAMRARHPTGHSDPQAPARCGTLRLTDPRRFGAVLWHDHHDGEVEQHKLLQGLGIEPFDPRFDGAFLHQSLRNRRLAIKQALLQGDVVVGVGNIYASEALFSAHIRPTTAAQRISLPRCVALAGAIRSTLAQAIEAGGSSLRDFVGSDGAPGHFQTQTHVYGRTGEPCHACGTAIRCIRQGQRSTFFCPRCQR
jgi:formamidopyrimidine-DNA glycosylase